MSGEPRSPCVLCAGIADGSRLRERLGNAEAHHAVDRCLKRMERAAAACEGQIVGTLDDGLAIAFDSAEAAMNAADEMQQRVNDLPPVSGLALAIRIGFHSGLVADKRDGLPANALDVASRLVTLAGAGQSLTTAETVAALPEQLRCRVRPLDTLPAKRGDSLLRLFEVLPHRNDDEPAAGDVLPEVAQSGGRRLWLRHEGQNLILGPDRPAARLGRDLNADVVIRDSRASRNHGRIEFRRDQYVLIDQSTNGTYVTFTGEPEFALKRGETPLRGRGIIRFGHAGGSEAGEMIEFEVLGS